MKLLGAILGTVVVFGGVSLFTAKVLAPVLAPRNGPNTPESRQRQADNIAKPFLMIMGLMMVVLILMAVAIVH
ncbi:MAG: hypothetical protein JWP74_3485 [Marmoricola sp.]|nr:hypothetical protein [Marmoricola sp.]